MGGGEAAYRKMASSSEHKHTELQWSVKQMR